MTVITAIHDPDKGVTWLGSNGRATIGSFIGPSIDKKWIAFDGWLIGVTGTGPKIEALLAHEEQFPKKTDCPFEVLKFMRSAYADFDIGEMEEGLKRYCGGGLLIHQNGRVWDFDSRFCLTPVAQGGFWERGSGVDLAVGAGKAPEPFVSSPKELTQRVLEIVVANDIDSPGEALIQTFDADGVLSDPIEL